jgi:hypothetical protein
MTQVRPAAVWPLASIAAFPAASHGDDANKTSAGMDALVSVGVIPWVFVCQVRPHAPRWSELARRARAQRAGSRAERVKEDERPTDTMLSTIRDTRHADVPREHPYLSAAASASRRRSRAPLL